MQSSRTALIKQAWKARVHKVSGNRCTLCWRQSIILKPLSQPGLWCNCSRTSTFIPVFASFFSNTSMLRALIYKPLHAPANHYHHHAHRSSRHRDNIAIVAELARLSSATIRLLIISSLVYNPTCILPQNF